MPIWRGAGINQEALLTFAKTSISCPNVNTNKRTKWLHVFPEGGVYQYKDESLGTHRSKDKINEIGHLKWGIGKVIAHSPTYQSIYNSHNNTGEGKGSPQVIPFHISGMEAFTPMEIVSRKILSYIPKGGHHVTVTFGPPICFDDLIQSYEIESGHRIRKYHCCSNPCEHTSIESIDKLDFVPSEDMIDIDSWVSTSRELELYKKITHRIESEMNALRIKCTSKE
jgi:hypothetical protein